MLEKALVFARVKHGGQVRRVTNVPYVTHPIRVSHLVSRYKVSKHQEDLQAAALLHDTLEDTNTTVEEIAREFGGMVVSLVVELTSDQQQVASMGKTSYLRKKLLGMSSYALVIKLCDRLDNVTDSPRPLYFRETLEILDWVQRKGQIRSAV